MKCYCFECAPLFNGGQSVSTSSLTATQYQLDKFAKHVTPTFSARINSVFDQADHAAYANYIVSSSVSGCLEIDDQGRHNYVYLAGKQTGITFIAGVPSTACDSVKVVLPYNSSSIHAYPTASGHAYQSGSCDNCGCKLAS